MWLTLIALLAAQAPATTMPGWLAGGWSAEAADGAWTEEWWTPPRAEVMMGAGRSGKAGKLDWWEHTRIEQVGGRMRFCALPKGQAGQCFAATRVSAGEIVFENPAHDFPTRIAYRRAGDELFAEVSGRNGANVQRWRFKKID